MINKREILYKSLIYFFPLLVLISSVATIITAFKNRTDSQLYKEIELANVDSRVETIKKELEFVTSDLISFANFFELKNYWYRTADNEVRTNLNNYFLQLSALRKMYDQIRVLNNSGEELIRINYDNGNPNIVPKEQLQNKKNRYYFIETIQLSEGEIYVSPLDLNIENNKIEVPLKPMIRFGTPVFDNNGEKKGIVVLNYFGSTIISHVLEQQSKSVKHHTMLLNKDGYWLKGMSAEQEWGFMYEDKKDVKFGNYFSEEWKVLKSEELNQIETKNGLFTFNTIYPVLNSKNETKITTSEEYLWKIISFLPRKQFYAEQKSRNRLVIISVLFLALVTYIFSWKLAKNRYLKLIAEEKLKKEEALLRELNITKDKFFSIVAHDLRSPFNALLGFTDIIKEELQKGNLENSRKYYGLIETKLKTTYDLLNQLLEWGNLQLKRITFEPQLINAYNCAKETVETLNFEASAKNITINNKVDAAITIWADRKMFCTVLRNLISNAVKFTNENGNIEITAILEQDNYCTFSIKDSGIGIPKNIVTKLFRIEENVTTDGTNKEKGTGLGLILCKEFVEKHSGKIWVESEPQKGSTFYFTLPVNQ